MKQLLSLLSLVFLSYSSFSAELNTEIKINSFTYVGNTRLAELCGQVTNQKTNPSFIQILVDPRGKHPVNYNTLAGKGGQFCIAIITYTGEADATLL